MGMLPILHPIFKRASLFKQLKNSTVLDKNREEIVSFFSILPLTKISSNRGRTRLIPL